MFETVDSQFPVAVSSAAMEYGLGGCPIPVLESGVALRHSGPLSRLHRGIPKRPGVYYFVGADGEILYVGKSKNLSLRVAAHLRSESLIEKSGKLAQLLDAIHWEVTPDELGALLREHAVICSARPRYNVASKPDESKHVYLGVGRKSPARVRLTRRPGTSSLEIGPIKKTRLLVEAVHLLNDCLRLRDCPDTTEFSFDSQLELWEKPPRARCHRHAVDKCHAPCIGACTSREYRQSERKAREFLDGSDRTVIDRIEQRIARHVAALEFEDARRWEERREILAWLADIVDNEPANRLTFVYSVGGAEDEHWYLLRRGIVEACCMPNVSGAARDAFVSHLRLAILRASERPNVWPDPRLAERRLAVSYFRSRDELFDRVISYEDALDALSSVAAG